MYLTLYKNCILTNEYKDVILPYKDIEEIPPVHYFNQYILGKYLSNLDSITIEIEKIYYKLQDKIILDKAYFSENNFGFNYLRLSKYDYEYLGIEEETFFAFITNIEYSNECVIISYEEDVFSNWGSLIKIRNSLLTASKNLKVYNENRNISYYRLPIDYKTNNNLNITSISNISKLYQIMVKIQKYKLNQAGEKTERIIICGIINRIVPESAPAIWSPDFGEDFEDIEEMLVALIQHSNYTTDSNNYYFTIDEIYLIPKEFGFQTSGYSSYEITTNIRVIDIEAEPDEKGLYKTINYTIEGNDFTLSRIGTLTHNLEIKQNGTNIQCKVLIYKFGYSFNILLNVGGNILDITNDFLLELPFSSADASSLALQKMSKDLQISGLNNKIDNEYTNKVGNMIGKFVSGATLSGATESGNPTSYGGGVIGNIISGSVGEIKNENNIKYSKEQIEILNRDLYNPNSVLINKMNYITIFYGICKFNIVPSNLSQVLKVKNNLGYVVNEVVDNFFDGIDNTVISNIINYYDGYDVIKFDNLTIYNIPSQKHRKILENILKNGTRIWFTENINV